MPKATRYHNPKLAHFPPCSLDDLDRYLEAKNYPFTRYADDFVISVRSPWEGQGVMEDVKRLSTLKLPISEEKSHTVPVSALSFLGNSFKGRYLNVEQEKSQ